MVFVKWVRRDGKPLSKSSPRQLAKIIKEMEAHLAKTDEHCAMCLKERHGNFQQLNKVNAENTTLRIDKDILERQAREKDQQLQRTQSLLDRDHTDLTLASKRIADLEHERDSLQKLNRALALKLDAFVALAKIV